MPLLINARTVMASCIAHMQQMSGVPNEVDVQVVIIVWDTPEVSKPGIKVRLARGSHNIVISVRKEEKCLSRTMEKKQV